MTVLHPAHCRGDMGGSFPIGTSPEPREKLVSLLASCDSVWAFPPSFPGRCLHPSQGTPCIPPRASPASLPGRCLPRCLSTACLHPRPSPAFPPCPARASLPSSGRAPRPAPPAAAAVAARPLGSAAAGGGRAGPAGPGLCSGAARPAPGSPHGSAARRGAAGPGRRCKVGGDPDGERGDGRGVKLPRWGGRGWGVPQRKLSVGCSSLLPAPPA